MKLGHLKIMAISGWVAWIVLLGWTTLWRNIGNSNDRYRDRAVLEATRRFSTPGDGVARPFEIVKSWGWSPAATGFVTVRFRDGSGTSERTYQLYGDELK